MSIIIKTDPAKEWETRNPNKSFKRHLGKEEKPEEIRTAWYHEGHNSQSEATRDTYAANALFAQGKKFIAEWNENDENMLVRFAGIEFVTTEGGWSDTDKNVWTGERKYKAGGTAMGYALIYP